MEKHDDSDDEQKRGHNQHRGRCDSQSRQKVSDSINHANFAKGDVAHDLRGLRRLQRGV